MHWTYMSKAQKQTPFRPFPKAAALIRERMDQNNWKLRDAEDALFVSKSSINNILHGKTRKPPQLETLVAMAPGLNVSLRTLLEAFDFEVDGPEVSEADLARYRKEYELRPYELAILGRLSEKKRQALIELARQMDDTDPLAE